MADIISVCSFAPVECFGFDEPVVGVDAEEVEIQVLETEEVVVGVAGEGGEVGGVDVCDC